MSDWSPDLELELACRVGALTDAIRALEEGAGADADGGSPLFICIMGGHRDIARLLLEYGADASIYLPKSRMKKLKTHDDILEALMEGTPPPAEPEEKAAVTDDQELESLNEESSDSSEA